MERPTLANLKMAPDMENMADMEDIEDMEDIKDMEQRGCTLSRKHAGNYPGSQSRRLHHTNAGGAGEDCSSSSPSSSSHPRSWIWCGQTLVSAPTGCSSPVHGQRALFMDECKEKS